MATNHCRFPPHTAALLLLLPLTAATFLAGPAAVTLEHMDPTLPPSLASGPAPKCSVLALSREFADTVQSLPAASSNYTQPDECPAPWTRVVLELSGSASDIQRDRIAAIWISGVEILRTTTPLPAGPGAHWRVEKDVTRYAAALRRLAAGVDALHMMLENSNATLPGVYFVNVTLHFYRGPVEASTAEPTGASFRRTAHPTVKGLYREPADLIVPVSQPFAVDGHGFCFKVSTGSQLATAPIAIPLNTFRAVLEIFASHHGDDELWYSNPLRSSYELGSTGGASNGGFRQLYATVDGQFVGGHIPFAVIYPGSINPYFWSPVTAIGAFDIPSYDLDLTPFLGLLLDGGVHEVGLGVKDGQSYWLLTGNLHLWVDPFSDEVSAGVIEYNAPPVKLNRHAEWRDMDGQSEINGEGLLRFSGWVSSSRGNLTTEVRQKLKFKSQVEVQNRGAVKQVEVINKERTTVSIMKSHLLLGRAQLFVEAPMQVQTSTVTAVGGAVFERTRLSHQLMEVANLVEGQVSSISALSDRQDAEGSVLMHGGDPVWGSGATKSTYKYRDEATCYLRTVNSVGGLVNLDTAIPSCSAIAEA